MVDSTFFKKKSPYTLEEVANVGMCEIWPHNTDKNISVENIATIIDAKKHEITFLANDKYTHYLGRTEASACIVDQSKFAVLDSTIPLLLSKNPQKSYALIARMFYPNREFESEISLQAAISKTAKIGTNCRIEPFVYIGENVLIGANTVIRSGAYIAQNVVIGDNCVIEAGCVIQYSIIGNNVNIHVGAKIGQEGFGFASDENGHIRIPQLGRVLICDDVVIGANTCIDRGAIRDTIIGKGSQIDNLVQIAHNVEIGRYCVIVSQVGIAGSTKIDDYVVIGGQAGIAGHLKIGKATQIAAKSGVTKDLKENLKVGGCPAVHLNEWKKQVIFLKNLIKKNQN